MRSKRSLSIGIAAAILLSSIVLGVAPVSAGDRPSLDDHDRPTLGVHDRPVRSVGDRPSLSSRTAANATTTPQDEVRQVAPDTVVLDVQVYENGTAKCKISYRTRLDDAETAAAFSDYAADVRNNSRQYSRQFVDRMNSTIQSAERFTGREMEGTDYSVHVAMREFPQRYGVVTYSFEWQGFANVSDDRVRVGDALSGLVLDENTRLLVEWPAGYEAATIRSEPETRSEESARAVVWNGPLEFSSDEPRVVLTAPDTDTADGGPRLHYDRAGTPGLPWPTSPGAGLRLHP